jgi:methyl-accepting chemotaxis protein
MEEISGRLQHIRRACEEQKEQSEEIVQAVGAIRQTAGSHLEATGVLQDAVAGLARQVDMLDGEMQVFQLMEGPKQ